MSLMMTTLLNLMIVTVMRDRMNWPIVDEGDSCADGPE